MTARVQPSNGYLAMCLLLAISGTTAVGAFQSRLEQLEQQLLQAVQAGSLERVQRLHSAGARLDSSISVNGRYTTALVEAIRADHVDVVRFLVCEGAPLDASFPDGLGGYIVNPLAEAERLGREEISDLFLDLIRQREDRPCPPSGG